MGQWLRVLLRLSLRVSPFVCPPVRVFEVVGETLPFHPSGVWVHLFGTWLMIGLTMRAMVSHDNSDHFPVRVVALGSWLVTLITVFQTSLVCKLLMTLVRSCLGVSSLLAPNASVARAGTRSDWLTDRFDIDIFVSSSCILSIITLVPSIAHSLSVGSGARVFVAKSEPFCALQACMGGSRGQRATDVIIVGKYASAYGYGGDCNYSIRDSRARPYATFS